VYRLREGRHDHLLDRLHAARRELTAPDVRPPYFAR
jgi:hypothetical protein